MGRCKGITGLAVLDKAGIDSPVWGNRLLVEKKNGPTAEAMSSGWGNTVESGAYGPTGSTTSSPKYIMDGSLREKVMESIPS